MIGDVLTQISAASVEGFIALLQEHPLLTPVLMQFFGGDVAIHMFGVLYGSGDISAISIVTALTIMLFFDTFTFYTVRKLKQSNVVLKSIKDIQFLANIETFFKKHERRHNTSPTLLLIAIKLMPLSKITVIFFALSQKMSTTKFTIQNSIISAVWFAMVFVPGWLIGRGFLAQEAGIQASSFIGYFTLIIILVLLFNKKIDQVLMWGIDRISSVFGKNKRVM